MRYFIEVAYFGTQYCGWQRQPNALAVQEVLEQAMSTFLRVPITVMGAGRTDAGVHAKQLFAHFDTDAIEDCNEISYRLNALLPKDISVIKIHAVATDAHARFHATERAYEYHVSLRKDPFRINLAYQLYQTPNLALMNEAAALLLGHQDFQCFSRSNTDVKTYYCTVYKAIWEQQESSLVFHIRADRFLRNMVRAIVGTLLDVGFEKIAVAEVATILASKDRRKAGASAPAQGLYLTEVVYPNTIFKT